MIQLLNVAEIIKKPSGLVFFYDVEGRLLETPRAVKEIRRFYNPGFNWSLEFTFDDNQRQDVQFQINRITLIQYAAGKFQTYADLGNDFDIDEYHIRFEAIYAYLADYVFIGCCSDDPDVVPPFPYPSNTYADWLTTLNADLLPKGLWIEVTDIPSQPSAIFSLFCTETNQIALGGFGQFLNADWQNVGDYSGVLAITGVPFTANIGQWYVALEGTAVDGDVVIYNCLHYQVIDAAAFAGTAPDVTPLAYTLLPKATANTGYILEVDEIEFDFVPDWLQYRADKRGNTYRYSQSYDAIILTPFGFTAIDLFQWGRDAWYSNDIYESYISQINTAGRIYLNQLNYSAIYGNVFVDSTSVMAGNRLFGSSSIFDNVLVQNSSINSNNLSLASSIDTNTISSNSAIDTNNITGNSFLRNKNIDTTFLFSAHDINVSLTFTETILSNDQNKSNTLGLSTELREIDITGLTTLDIGTNAELVGIYDITSGNATETINLITNYPTLFPFTLKPAAGLILTVTFTAVASVAANGEIISSTAFLALNGDNDDEITLNATTSGGFGVLEVIGAINNA